MEKTLLWYWGDSDCNWFPFLIEISPPKAIKLSDIPRTLLESLNLHHNIGTNHIKLDHQARFLNFFCLCAAHLSQMFGSKISQKRTISFRLIRRKAQKNRDNAPLRFFARLPMALR